MVVEPTHLENTSHLVKMDHSPQVVGVKEKNILSGHHHGYYIIVFQSMVFFPKAKQGHKPMALTILAVANFFRVRGYVGFVSSGEQ